MARSSICAVVVLALAACRGGAPSSPEAGPPDFLVWTDVDDHPVTRWLDASGHERGRAPGLYLAVEGTLWRLEREVSTQATTGCRTDDAGRPVSGHSSLTTIALASVDGRTRLVVTRPEPRAADEYDTYDHGVIIRASLGPLLFGEATVDQFACGAHGSGTVSAFTFDVTTRALLPVAPHRPPPTLAPRIQAAFEAEAIEPLEVGAAPWLGESLPRWTDGRLGARHLAYVDTCYACSNGEWSSYTTGLWVEDVGIPDPWAIAAVVPPAIAAIISSPDPVATGVSWGPPDAGWTQTFASRPAR